VLQFGSFQPLHTAAEQDQLADGADGSVESANDRVAAFELSPRGRQTPKILLQILRLVVVFLGMDHPSIHHLSKESRRKLEEALGRKLTTEEAKTFAFVEHVLCPKREPTKT
jgi:hypothetical protein